MKPPLSNAINFIVAMTAIFIVALFITVSIEKIPFDKVVTATFANAIVCIAMKRNSKMILGTGMQLRPNKYPMACSVAIAVFMIGTAISIRFHYYLESLSDVPPRIVPATQGQPILIAMVWCAIAIWTSATTLYVLPDKKKFQDQLRKTMYYQVSENKKEG